MEIAQRNIKLIFCDLDHNPVSELNPLYGHHRTSQRMLQQCKWNKQIKDFTWQQIIIQKINNQAKVLKINGSDEGYNILKQFARDVKIGDVSNREGHAAKVYFNHLFGVEFSRSNDSTINHLLDYGYSILLSCFNKEIVAGGCATQLGIHHINEYNQFNFACDLMECFRPIIDNYVVSNPVDELDSSYKYELINIFNQYYEFNYKNYTLKDIIHLYTQGMISYLNDPKDKKVVKFQL